MADATEDDRPPHDATLTDRPPDDATLTDRRRPGRMDFRNGRLIALLRGRPLIVDAAKAEVDAAPKMVPVDDLAPARGIIIGAAIGAALWAAIIFAGWHFM